MREKYEKIVKNISSTVTYNAKNDQTDQTISPGYENKFGELTLQSTPSNLSTFIVSSINMKLFLICRSAV